MILLAMSQCDIRRFRPIQRSLKNLISQEPSYVETSFKVCFLSYVQLFKMSPIPILCEQFQILLYCTYTTGIDTCTPIPVGVSLHDTHAVGIYYMTTACCGMYESFF